MIELRRLGFRGRNHWRIPFNKRRSQSQRACCEDRPSAYWMSHRQGLILSRRQVVGGRFQVPGVGFSVLEGVTPAKAGVQTGFRLSPE